MQFLEWKLKYWLIKDLLVKVEAGSLYWQTKNIKRRKIERSFSLNLCKNKRWPSQESVIQTDKENHI